MNTCDTAYGGHVPAWQHRWMLVRLCLLAMLLLSYPLAHLFAPQFAWENGPLENAQVLVLLCGFLLSLYFARMAKDQPVRWFWIAIAPIWFILAARELSWGAAILLPGSMANPYIGPIFSSRQLWYRPMVVPAVAGVLIASLFFLVYFRAYRTLVAVVRQRQFPWGDLCIAMVAITVAIFCEKGALGLHARMGPYAVFMEELSELVAYLAVSTMQLQVHRAIVQGRREMR